MKPKTYPETIKKYWYSIDWDVEALWQLDLPVEEFSIQKLEWHLDIPVWEFNNRKYSLSPNQVLDDPKKYHLEYLRVQKADLNFPIEIIYRNSRWMILDGIHRLLKSYESGLQKIMVRKVPEKYIKVINNYD